MKSLTALMGEQITHYLAEKTSIVIVGIDRHGIIVDCNHGFMELLGLQTSPAGEEFKRFLAPDSHDSINKALEPELSETRINFKGGSGTIHSLTCSVYKHEGGHLIIGERPLLTENTVMKEISLLNNELVNTARELHDKNEVLQNALNEIKTLRGMLPICSYCKKIRDDKGYWERIESYVQSHTEARFSHGICPECIKKHYPEYSDDAELMKGAV